MSNVLCQLEFATNFFVKKANTHSLPFKTLIICFNFLIFVLIFYNNWPS
ncbi:hypothetical protein SAMN06265379_1143 [Saccharicrinis carchari]|uniref:Uncharacterized protein n=1 Tax=Saccharicrinis carchari TaxID=1168039 RepID=A0A521F3T3_SACCC|nr:hypothetical protein SAMN06265379_1143 [Saccharicrinis carchari]